LTGKTVDRCWLLTPNAMSASAPSDHVVGFALFGSVYILRPIRPGTRYNAEQDRRRDGVGPASPNDLISSLGAKLMQRSIHVSRPSPGDVFDYTP